MSPIQKNLKSETNSLLKSPLLTSKNTVLALAALLVIALAVAFHFYTVSVNDQKDPQKELQQTISKVGHLMLLPTNETPTMATVSDPEKLKDQTFFAHASLGDKVLIYTQSKKAILYSPSKNMIIEVSSLNISQ